MTSASSKQTAEEPGVNKMDVTVLVLNGLALIAFALAGADLFPGSSLADQAGTLDVLLLVTLTGTSLVALCRQLPVQNVLLAAVGIALIGSGVHTLGVKTEMPFGPFTFRESAGFKIWDTLPWMIPLLWIVILFTARGVARLILRPWRKAKSYGYRLIALTAILTALFDVGFDPFATHAKHYWFWTLTKLPLTWQGAPLVNFLVWGAVAALMLAFTTPALIRKQPGQKSGPDYHPLVVWLGSMLLFGTAAGLAGHWPVVAVDAALGIIVAAAAIRGALW